MLQLISLVLAKLTNCYNIINLILCWASICFFIGLLLFMTVLFIALHKNNFHLYWQYRFEKRVLKKCQQNYIKTFFFFSSSLPFFLKNVSHGKKQLKSYQLDINQTFFWRMPRQIKETECELITKN